MVSPSAYVDIEDGFSGYPHLNTEKKIDFKPTRTANSRTFPPKRLLNRQKKKSATQDQENAQLVVSLVKISNFIFKTTWFVKVSALDLAVEERRLAEFRTRCRLQVLSFLCFIKMKIFARLNFASHDRIILQGIFS